MKKGYIWLGLCLLLALAVTKHDSVAQVIPANTLMAGAGMETPSGKFLEAFQKSDHAAMFEQTAPWKQNALKLVQARMLKKIADGQLTEEQIKAWLNKQDPSAKSGTKTVEELKATKSPQFFALHVGLWQLPVRTATTWLLVERAVGLQEPKGQGVLPWGGVMRFESEAGDTMQLTLAIDTDKWVITDFSMALGNAVVDFGGALTREAGGPRAWTAEEKEVAEEGKLLLSSARDFCRVEYSKTGSAAAVTKAFNREVADGSFEGEYYEVTDYIKDTPGSDFDAAIVAEPKDESNPWLLIEFKWQSGKSEIEWLDGKGALDERIRELTEEKE